jgi:hypothetical protein
MFGSEHSEGKAEMEAADGKWTPLWQTVEA